MREVLKIENLKKYYGVNSNITKAVNGISLNISESEFVAIMGASGSGKTTLLNLYSIYRYSNKWTYLYRQ